MSDELRGRRRNLARAHSDVNIHDRQAEPSDGYPRSTSAQYSRKSLRKCEDLRQLAVRNGHRSSQLSLALSGTQSLASAAHSQQFPNKTIAMVPHEAKARPNWEYRWSSFTLTQSSRPTQPRASSVSSKEPKPMKSSVSPLTKLGSSSSKAVASELETIASPPGPGPPSTENRFADTSIQACISGSASESQYYKPEKHSSSSFLTHSRPSSKTLRSSVYAPASQYVSELDSSDNEESVVQKNADVSLLDEVIDAATPSSILMNTENFQAFQRSLISSVPEIQPTRTQRKVLDFKDLFSNDVVPGQSNLGSLGYTAKIQHEEIFAEWTQIRLRFSSHLQSKNKARCRAGTLGFLDRYLNRGWPEPDALVPDDLCVTKETKDDFLIRLWQSGQTRPTQTNSQPNSLPSGLTLNRNSNPIPASSLHPMLEEEEGDIYKEKARFNISSLAQVAISRQSSVG